MATILRNDDAEALILDIRAGRSAAAQAIDEHDGAFLVFPTSVVTPCPTGGQAVFPLATGVEPGTLVAQDGSGMVSGLVDGIVVAGTFSWTCSAAGDAPAVEPARYHFERRGQRLGAPRWADQLPRSQCLARRTPTMLAREQARLVRRGRLAEHWLLTMTERIVRQSCRSRIRLAVSHRTPVDVDDVVQRGLQTACRLLPVYASAGRPPCSWLGMIKLDGKRDMHREVCRLDWVPRSMVSSAAPEVSTLASFESLPPSVLDASLARVSAEIEAVDDRCGHATAEVARLAGGDAEAIALAVGGDSSALARVSKQVLAALARAGETQARTRLRCWDEFQSSGRLFATDMGLTRFSSSAGPGLLAAIDASLAEAAGRCEHATGSW